MSLSEWPSEAHLQKCAGGHPPCPTVSRRSITRGGTEGGLAVRAHPSSPSFHSPLRGKKMTSEEKRIPGTILDMSGATLVASSRLFAPPLDPGSPMVLELVLLVFIFFLCDLRRGFCICALEFRRGLHEVYCKQPGPWTVLCSPPPQDQQCRRHPGSLWASLPPVLSFCHHPGLEPQET